MSTPPLDKLEVCVGDYSADAALTQQNGVYCLFIRAQTADQAVRHVRNLIPELSYDAARALIREQCPELKDLDELLGAHDAPTPSIERPPAVPEMPTEPPRAKPWRSRAVLVAAMLPALAASFALGHYTDIVGSDTDTAAATAVDAPDVTSASDPAPFVAPRFTHFAGAGNIDCSPISPLEAECTDADGIVMSSKAATGPDSTLFTFSYGSEQIGLRIFYDSGYADTWSRQKGTRELYPNLRQHGRYILWGTDEARIKEYGDLLDDADRTGEPVALGQSAPLPPRLAALTLGTLGVDEHQVNQLMATSAPTTGEAPALLAARMVLGIDTAPSYPGHGDDIVAIAAGIEPSAPKAPVIPPVLLPVSDPAPGTGSGSQTTPPPPVSVPPVSTPSTAPPPTSPSVPPPGPAETTPPVTPPPTTPPVTVPPTTPPVTVPPPVDPVQPVPVEPEVPAPIEEPPAPVDPTPVPEPTDPVEEVPPPVEDEEDQVVILDSAWTVAA